MGKIHFAIVFKNGLILDGISEILIRKLFPPSLVNQLIFSSHVNYYVGNKNKNQAYPNIFQFFVRSALVDFMRLQSVLSLSTA